MKTLAIATTVLSMLCLGPSAGFAQVKGVYWTTSGMFGPFPMVELVPSLPKEKQRDVTIPINMWIIDHPKGLVVFDTGNNVAISDGKCKSYWTAFCDLLKPSQKRDDVIDMQMKKLGYSPDQVKAVITSHAHLDHIGNIKLFPKAVHVIQKKELYQAWWPEKFQGRTGGAFVMGDFDGPAREFNYLELEGDYDLFGDGSVVVLSTPGHTLGHQSVKVRLASGQTLLMAQDAIWFKENLEGYPAGLNYSVKDYNASIQRLKMIRDLENAEIYFGHDGEQWKEKGGPKWFR
ncbi:MAG TPA: N-acyl homoserine lactonase family protein [Methylomirabilota bacterium]|jgi:glyoxylase-like metal-dependent hydrolase (beta-lactamase superfamily II)|nr:N-acyl homoserine lactonase family protein [Methylomirabilota bacterium]